MGPNPMESSETVFEIDNELEIVIFKVAKIYLVTQSTNDRTA